MDANSQHITRDLCHIAGRNHAEAGNPLESNPYTAGTEPWGWFNEAYVEHLYCVWYRDADSAEEKSLISALRNYHDAQLLGQPQREKAIQKVRDGIACFASLEDALRDAEENIKRYTRSNFQNAHFYEVVRTEVKSAMQAADVK